MEKRKLGKTDLDLTPLSFGASSMGAEFRQINIAEAFKSVHVAIDRGMNFIDTSPFYGRGMSEVLLGQVLPEIDRDKYILGTKLGRYSGQHFDFPFLCQLRFGWRLRPLHLSLADPCVPTTLPWPRLPRSG